MDLCDLLIEPWPSLCLVDEMDDKLDNLLLSLVSKLSQLRCVGGDCDPDGEGGEGGEGDGGECICRVLLIVCGVCVQSNSVARCRSEHECNFIHDATPISYLILLGWNAVYFFRGGSCSAAQ